MLTEFEGKVVKFLETIAECLVKSNEMAKEALKKNNQLYEANKAMMKESQIEIIHDPYKIELTEEQEEILEDLNESELQTPDSNTYDEEYKPEDECNF